MEKEERDCRLCISYRSGIARMAHRIASWLRTCVAGRQGGRTISSASVTASKIAALQQYGAYLATMQSLWMMVHRGPSRGSV